MRLDPFIIDKNLYRHVASISKVFDYPNGRWNSLYKLEWAQNGTIFILYDRVSGIYVLKYS
jgi:hypothetical protein